MKIHFPHLLLIAGLALATSSASAETRMQVSAASTPLYSQPTGNAQQVGKAAVGEILFVSHLDGDWVAISPPDRIAVWLNKDFIEGNRVIAKSIQIRSGPGIQYDILGILERGAPVMPRDTEGDWCKIAPPSSATVWVKKSDLSEVLTHTTPIREVAAVAVPVPAPPAPEPKPAEAAPKPQPPPPPEPIQTPAPASHSVESPVVPATPVKVSPSTPHAPAPVPVPAPAPAPASVSVPTPAAAPIPHPQPVAKPVAPPIAMAPHPVAPHPAVPHSATPPPPPLRPATALPGAAPRTPQPAPLPRITAPAVQAVPAPASAVSAQKAKDIEVEIDPALVEDLDLLDQPYQGKGVQVEGELRNAPFLAASPSRYRLLAYDGQVLEMVCHIHGRADDLRPYVGKNVSIRGREYWVEKSDMPVVVVGQIVPLSPASEPVLF